MHIQSDLPFIYIGNSLYKSNQGKSRFDCTKVSSHLIHIAIWKGANETVHMKSILEKSLH